VKDEPVGRLGDLALGWLTQPYPTPLCHHIEGNIPRCHHTCWFNIGLHQRDEIKPSGDSGGTRTFDQGGQTIR
jgi:hypothetical protein